ncbi:hypothetical protein HA402_009484 [Bradysia odoriphaga]|nr:hypothetical protein HA402_009484 [Bradysia odoriphaga]
MAVHHPVSVTDHQTVSVAPSPEEHEHDFLTVCVVMIGLLILSYSGNRLWRWSRNRRSFRLPKRTDESPVHPTDTTSRSGGCFTFSRFMRALHIRRSEPLPNNAPIDLICLGNENEVTGTYCNESGYRTLGNDSVSVEPPKFGVTFRSETMCRPARDMKRCRPARDMLYNDRSNNIAYTTTSSLSDGDDDDYSEFCRGVCEDRAMLSTGCESIRKQSESLFSICRDLYEKLIFIFTIGAVIYQ